MHVHRSLPVLASAVALALPGVTTATAAAKATPKKKVVTTTKRYTGPTVETGRWGPLEITVVVRTTTTTVGKKKTVKSRIVSLDAPVYPDHTDRSVFINQNALPVLFQEALQAQSANVDLLSRATDTSEAFVESLQGALAEAKLPGATSA